MKVVRAKSAGFCWGVRRAVDMASALAGESAGEPVWTDGPLIHNSREVARLAALGVRTAADPAALPAGSRLLVRAHGIPPARRAWLGSLPLALSDATCPKVTFIQKLCAKAAAEGRTVFILGDPDHAEVVGLLGHAGDRGFVVTGPADVTAAPDPGTPVALFSQSTQEPALFEKTAAAVRARWPDALVRNTICDATRSRQGELAALAEACDAIVVVGSPESANTQRLAALAGRLRPTVVVDRADAIDPAAFAGVATVGLTAGASTPDDLISEVENRLGSLRPPALPERTAATRNSVAPDRSVR